MGSKIPHSQRFEFAFEKSQLLKILEADWNARTADAWKPHPMFGKMTPTEWGNTPSVGQDSRWLNLTTCSTETEGLRWLRRDPVQTSEGFFLRIMRVDGDPVVILTLEKANVFKRRPIQYSCAD
jgi:hypothetical protein